MTAGWHGFLLVVLASEQQLSRDELPGLLCFWLGEKLFGRRAFDHAAAMQQHDLAGQAARLAEIVGGEHDLDAARDHRADHILDRLGGGGIEARGRLIEEKDFGIAGQRAGQCVAAAARRRTAAVPAARRSRRAQPA